MSKNDHLTNGEVALLAVFTLSLAGLAGFAEYMRSKNREPLTGNKEDGSVSGDKEKSP